MRVATLFKRLLRLGREQVVQVTLVEGGEEQVLVEVARPARRRMRCPCCGFQTRATYDRSVRSWRHLDVLRTRCLVRCQVRRIDCPDCGVVSEEVPWARPGSRFTRAFEDGCVWLSRDAPKSVVAQLMRVDWATVGRMIERVVDEALERRDPLGGLRMVGIDEVSRAPRGAIKPGGMRGPPPVAATAGRSWGQPGSRGGEHRVGAAPTT